MQHIHTIAGKPYLTALFECTDAPQTFGPSAVNDLTVAPRGVPGINALITAEGNNVRFTLDGTNPTQGVAGSGALGHILYNGASIYLANGAAIRQFTFINAVNGEDAYLQVSFEKEVGK